MDALSGFTDSSCDVVCGLGKSSQLAAAQVAFDVLDGGKRLAQAK